MKNLLFLFVMFLGAPALPVDAIICVNTDTASSTAAPTGTGDEHCAAPGTYLVWDRVNMPTGTGNVYVRADGVACTTGTVDIDVW